MKWLSKVNPFRILFNFIGDWIYGLWVSLYVPKDDKETDEAVEYFKGLKEEKTED